MILCSMGADAMQKKIGIIWTSYHYYLGEIARIISEAGTCVTVYIYLDSPEKIPHIDGIDFKIVTNVSSTELLNQVSVDSHDVILVCGWHLKPFRNLAKKFNGRVVLFMDNPWKKSLKQILGILIFKVKWLKYYDAVVVPGSPQIHFAKYLGFQESNIQEGFFSFLSPQLSLPDQVNPRREFIFIGRLIGLKGVAELAKGYRNYRSHVSDPWPLIVCGQGPLRHLLEKEPGVQMRGFLNKNELFSELSSPRVFISCGEGEHWGISIYESAYFYHPLILSKDAGSASEYLLDGRNGISIRGRNVGDIAQAMLNFHNLQDSELETYAKASNELVKKHDSNFFKSEVLPFLIRGKKSD